LKSSTAYTFAWAYASVDEAFVGESAFAILLNADIGFANNVISLKNNKHFNVFKVFFYPKISLF
jgi:hypothetical protein